MPNPTTRCNGIDADALRQTARAVEQNPALGIAKFHVKTAWTGGTRSESRIVHFELGGKRIARSHTVLADEPRQVLGEDRAANPQELLMAALNACMTVGYVAGCALRGIELESLEIETIGQLDTRGFLGLDPSVKPGYEELRYTVRIRGNGTKQQFQEIHEQVIATSPNFSTLATPVRLVPTLVVEGGVRAPAAPGRASEETITSRACRMRLLA